MRQSFKVTFESTGEKDAQATQAWRDSLLEGLSRRLEFTEKYFAGDCCGTDVVAVEPCDD
jgi:hypothetical protein